MKTPELNMDLFVHSFRLIDTQIQEKIVDYNNLQRISWLREALRVAGTVGRVVTPGGYGTGWLIGDDLIITNNHVLDHEPDPETCWIEFNYETNWKGESAPVDRYSLVKLLKTQSGALDYSIIKVEGRPGEKYGFNDIKDAKRPSLDSAATLYPVIVQHPSGGFKQIALTDNYLKLVKDGLCWYTTDTEPGSSGSPVFDQLWRPFALHHAGGPQAMPDGSTQILNEGILLADIVEDAASILGKATEHLRVVMKDLLRAGHFATSLPSLEWYLDNPRIHNAIKLDAKGDDELASIIAAAAGVAAGAVATHWTNEISNEMVILNPGMAFQLPPNVTQAGVFDIIYDSLLRDKRPALVTLAMKDKRYEIAPLAGAFLAGVAAGAAV
ncbi:trypsin-like serine peptidase [Pseudomonas fluorescens]|uniref:trypsin-like serine peptidase n=1 Tax=Pseudomonas fluorescens TaxID=294 RepID=UPI003C2175FC